MVKSHSSPLPPPLCPSSGKLHAPPPHPTHTQTGTHVWLTTLPVSRLSSNTLLIGMVTAKTDSCPVSVQSIWARPLSIIASLFTTWGKQQGAGRNDSLLCGRAGEGRGGAARCQGAVAVCNG